MNVQLDRRAAVHAALGEPIRLGIVDRLGPGDASPGELAEAFGLGTNLLAHHLKVLEEAGVIRRVQSEGDRRRSYVQLSLADPLVRAAAAGGRDAADYFGSGRWPRVVFVCTANSARSQLAAASWNRVSSVPALSAGTHPGARIHPRATTAARRHGLRLGRNRPVALDTVLQDDDLIIAVCDNAHEELDSTRQRLHWAVPDPVRVDTDEAFEAAYEEIGRRVDRLAAAVVPAPAHMARRLR